MCQLKSGILLKDRVFVSDHDHHTQMLEELKIKESLSLIEKKNKRRELLACL